jgi:hypothetical protein
VTSAAVLLREQPRLYEKPRFSRRLVKHLVRAWGRATVTYCKIRKRYLKTPVFRDVFKAFYRQCQLLSVARPQFRYLHPVERLGSDARVTASPGPGCSAGFLIFVSAVHHLDTLHEVCQQLWPFPVLRNEHLLEVGE